MIEVMDNWVPPARRDTVRALAREIDDTIGGFVVGQARYVLFLQFSTQWRCRLQVSTTLSSSA
jgi:predicted PurR-regulated permease PerM